jgi:hypothetical protein
MTNTKNLYFVDGVALNVQAGRTTVYQPTALTPDQLADAVAAKYLAAPDHPCYDAKVDAEIQADVETIRRGVTEWSA